MARLTPPKKLTRPTPPKAAAPKKGVARVSKVPKSTTKAPSRPGGGGIKMGR